MAVEMTLAEKVHAVMGAEDFRNPVDRSAKLPFELPSNWSTLQIDAQDWLLYYGVAVGLARTEEPCEPIFSVVERARGAANETFSRLNWDSDGAGAVAHEIENQAEVVA